MNRLRVLQIFSRYQQFGGEEGSVYRIGDLLQGQCSVEYFIKSTSTFLSGSPWEKASVPFKAIHNPETARQLRRMQEIGRFDLWLVHNVFPALSPSVFDEAFRLGVPIVHYLHNYRFFCANGFFLEHGRACQRCAGGNLLHAAATACWRDSHLASGWMGLVLARVRMLDVFNRVARWIALSEAQKAVHVQYGFPADRIEVIPHFYEPSGPPPPLPEDGYALFIGRLSVEKGCIELLKAWRQMPRHRKLVIAGEGPELPALRSYAEAEGLDNVEFRGFVPKEAQAALWQGAAFSVVPSIWLEPFGMVVLESWSHGRPVIAHAMGALPEIITPEKTGLLVPPFAPEPLAAAMERLFADRPLLAGMAHACREELETRFSKTVWLQKIERTLLQSLKPI